MKSFHLHIRACRRSIEPESLSSIANSYGNPLLSIADTSLAQHLSTNCTDVDYASSHIELCEDVFDNNVNSSDAADDHDKSFMSFKPSNTK
jgi:hypothetical protein